MRGMLTVFGKEMTDYFNSWRGIILFAIVILTTIFAVFGPSGALENIREELSVPTQFGSSEFVFLTLFTTTGVGATPIISTSFLGFIGQFLVPIVGVFLGFDAINNERNNGTLGRLLSQPIYRDAVFNGKFFAGLVTIAIMLTSAFLLVSALGLSTLGVPPSSEEAARIFLFLVLSILYGAFWMGLAMLFSVFFRRVSTSALASIAVWIFALLFATAISVFIANTLAPLSEAPSTAELFRNASLRITALRISPVGLFNEAMVVILVPGARSFGEILQQQILDISGAVFPPGPLPLSQSLLSIWPHLVTFIAITAVFFAISYARFMREEIRST